MTPLIHHLRVFADGPQGGNPLPLVVDASSMTDTEMQSIAVSTGHESSFIFPPPPNTSCDYEFRFWVPEHEMEMCGHATVGAVWLLEKLGRLKSDRVKIWTKSGVVDAVVTRRGTEVWVEISQGRGVVDVLKEKAEGVCAALGITPSDLSEEYAVQNARTSRIKTAIPVKSVKVLDSLSPNPSLVKEVCERIESTGLYPYAELVGEGKHVFSARQFPKSSGYVEDAATGIAASALAFALLENGVVCVRSEVTVKQGRAMGKPSSIAVRFRRGDDGEVVGCWIGGTAVTDDA